MSFSKVESRIDRRALVSRHDIHLEDSRLWTPVGNGEFCFSTDKTGLQTFSGNTLAHWAWHSFPVPEGVDVSTLPDTGSYYAGRLTGEGKDKVPEDKRVEGRYMFDNPHSFDLVRVRFSLPDGGMLAEEEVSNSVRDVELWTGLVKTSFVFGGGRVEVWDCVHPTEDTLAVRIRTVGIEKPLSVAFDFPYPSVECCGTWVADFESHDRHASVFDVDGLKNLCAVSRTVDDTRYAAVLSWTSGELSQTGKHTAVLSLSQNGETEFTLRFSSVMPEGVAPSWSETAGLAAEARSRFWLSGAAIDLSESSDPRWFELERRIVLSQHILAVQATGSFPCAEAGLMNIDPWRGQFHMEMLWWHAAHYAMWDRMELADRQLGCYKRFLPMARRLAAQTGYAGAKWGKSVGPEGRSAPFDGNLALIWKQPHPIFFAELEYRRRPTAETLEKWAEIIDETADHMADFAAKGDDGYYHLDPVMPPSELGHTRDTVFDLAYWQWALDTASLWRRRMGKSSVALWEDVARKLCPLPVQNGVYIRSPEWTETYEKQNYEHPDPVGVCGMLPPTELVDADIARATVKRIWAEWQRNRVWGWDFPWIAMCASRTDEPEIALEAMMYVDIDAVGACGAGSYPYLPANGGILYASAMMALGRNGEQAPGFPSDGGWTVRHEGLMGW